MVRLLKPFSSRFRRHNPAPDRSGRHRGNNRPEKILAMTSAASRSASDSADHGTVRCQEQGSVASVGASKIASKRFALARCCALAVIAFAPHAAAQDVPPPYTVSTDADGVQRVTIVGGSYFFEPARIIAKAGQPLDLVVRMERGIAPHRFVLEGADGKSLADVELAEAPKTVRVALAAGDYVFHCPNRLLMFRSHSERGMSGALEVRE